MTLNVAHIRTALLLTVAVALSATVALACGSPSTEPAGAQPADSEAPARPASLFKLPNANAPAGTEISLAQFRDAQPVVLVFYRAHW